MTLDFEGERMVPGKSDPITFWGHIYRYRFATKFIKKKRVLDIACGEGYGSGALFKAGALNIIGIDISEEACQHAYQKYRINTCVGEAEDIPLQNNSIDVVISFETIEHLHNPEKFIRECSRILTPKGHLVISTPNRKIYRQLGRCSTFHYSEMSEDEIVSLLKKYFSKVSLYSQEPVKPLWLSLRPLVHTSSPWLKLHGFWRLRRLIIKLCCPHLFEKNVIEKTQQFAINLILSADSPFSSLVNPYKVMRRFWTGRDFPVFLIAVARL